MIASWSEFAASGAYLRGTISARAWGTVGTTQSGRGSAAAQVTFATATAVWGTVNGFIIASGATAQAGIVWYGANFDDTTAVAINTNDVIKVTPTLGVHGLRCEVGALDGDPVVPARTRCRDTHLGTDNVNLRGTAVGWTSRALGTARGSGVVASAATATVTGATPGIEVALTGPVVCEWISPPVAADVTISGTITANMWAAESDMPPTSRSTW